MSHMLPVPPEQRSKGPGSDAKLEKGQKLPGRENVDTQGRQHHAGKAKPRLAQA